MRKNVLLGVMILSGSVVSASMWESRWICGVLVMKWKSWRVSALSLKKKQESLQVRLSELTDPQQIARRAHTQLGLIVPEEGQVVMISLEASPSSGSDERSPARLVQKFSDSLWGWP